MLPSHASRLQKPIYPCFIAGSVLGLGPLTHTPCNNNPSAGRLETRTIVIGLALNIIPTYHTGQPPTHASSHASYDPSGPGVQLYLLEPLLSLRRCRPFRLGEPCADASCLGVTRRASTGQLEATRRTLLVSCSGCDIMPQEWESAGSRLLSSFQTIRRSCLRKHQSVQLHCMSRPCMSAGISNP
ncbi:hypothetical protein BT67DRAFT_310133 [Trichocladium antarcticum]|uniref:Uncharacterized protein n=1 Tax=Trichocladium antarcticum TaxID=1450529 RepID=A0AAN6ZCM6_9PEZI|nr:hypothetical protein BT67DRAFT_310133 [Trichocladium antarcticum]